MSFPAALRAVTSLLPSGGPPAVCSLVDLRARFGVALGDDAAAVAESDVDRAAAEATLAAVWQAARAADRRRSDAQVAADAARVRAFLAPFDGAGEGEAVPFVALPYGLQCVLGGAAAVAWYAWADAVAATHTVLAPSAAVRRIAGSRWVRRSVPVRGLAASVLSAAAVATTWPDAPAVAPDPWGTAWDALVARGETAAPVVRCDSALHAGSVAYVVALLRFAPDAVVTVLDGASVAADAGVVPPPAAPAAAWSCDGSARVDRPQAGADEATPAARLTRARRLAASAAAGDRLPRLAALAQLQANARHRAGSPDRGLPAAGIGAFAVVTALGWVDAGRTGAAPYGGVPRSAIRPA